METGNAGARPIKSGNHRAVENSTNRGWPASGGGAPPRTTGRRRPGSRRSPSGCRWSSRGIWTVVVGVDGDPVVAAGDVFLAPVGVLDDGGVFGADDLAGGAEEPQVPVAGEGGPVHRANRHGKEGKVQRLVGCCPPRSRSASPRGASGRAISSAQGFPEAPISGNLRVARKTVGTSARSWSTANRVRTSRCGRTRPASASATPRSIFARK